MSDEVVEEGTAEEINFDDVEDETDGDGSRRPDSFIKILADFMGNLNYKLIIILFLSYVFLMSDLFLDKILQKVPDATTHRTQLTPKGTLINGLLLILLYMTADLLIKSKII
jgi:hypothetical protein